MQNVILVVHIIACLVMTGLVLIQKSEGGGLGIGGGGGGGAGSLMSGRGAAGALVRSTIMFGGIFFLTSLGLTTLANRNNDTRTEVERALGADEEGASGPVDLLDPTAPLLEGQDGLGTTPAPAPATDAPAELVDPTADLPTADPAEEPAPTEGNPQ
ncbi:MAG: preprotein translocase subunit SecG [Pseudomonadota bacterium]|jgi:preprotein translocase subunit SecG|nr:preprotein translocase subunit SecG [Pseudomonadota bacterium]